MPALPITVIESDTPSGLERFVAISPTEEAFQHGLPAEAILGTLSSNWTPNGPITSAVFTPNRAFVAFMHDIISRKAVLSSRFLAAAEQQRDGYVVLVDQRTSTPDGPVPPEDILGLFAVASGIVVVGSYQASPNHQLLTERGFVRLPDELERILLDELTIRQTEKHS